MDKSWKQLAERCQLFVDEKDGLLIELLKEAECELANRCSLYKQNFTILFRDNANKVYNKSNAFKLPSTYKQMISVHIDGDLIPYKNKDQFHFNQESNKAMSVDEGEPNCYTLSNGYIVFDTTPTSGVADLHFRANLQNNEDLPKSVLIAPSDGGSPNSVRVDITMGDLIDGLSVKYLEGDTVNVLSNISYQNSNDMDRVYPYDPNQQQRHTVSVSNDHRPNAMSTYQGEGSWTTSVTNNYYVRNGIIDSYRSVGPVIENDYHLALCDYALTIVTAKKEPVLSDKHRMLWEKTINDTINDNLDKELPIGIKEEI